MGAVSWGYLTISQSGAGRLRFNDGDNCVVEGTLSCIEGDPQATAAHDRLKCSIVIQ